MNKNINKYLNKKLLLTIKKDKEIVKRNIFKKEVTNFVSNLDKNYELTKKEFEICKIFKEINDYEEALMDSKIKKIIKNDNEFFEIVNKFVEENILVEINFDKESKFLNNIIVQRNYLEKDILNEQFEKELINYNENKESEKYKLEKNFVYTLLSLANGIINIETILNQITYSFNLKSIDEAKKVFEKYLCKFTKLNIWSVNYYSGNKEVCDKIINEDVDIFNFKNITEDSLIISIGYDIGKIKNENEGCSIIRGNEIVNLNAQEYEVWKSLNENTMKIGQLQFKYNKSKEVIIKDIIRPMLEKKIVLLWDLNFLCNSKIIRFISQGNKKEHKSKKSCKNIFVSILDLGYEVELNDFSCKLWEIICGQKTLTQIIEEMSIVSRNDDYDKLKEEVVENIKGLISLGLIKVDVILNKKLELIDNRGNQKYLNINFLSKDIVDRDFLVMIKIEKINNEKSLEMKRKIKVVNNLGIEYELLAKEHFLCNALIEKGNCKKAYLWCIERKIINSKQEFEECINKFLDYKILVEIDFDEDCLFMNNIVIKRNGIGLGAIEDEKWGIKVQYKDELIEKQIDISLLEKYIVWASANSFVSVKIVIENIKTLLNISNDEAISLLRKYLYEFVNLGIWDIDFLKKELDFNNQLKELDLYECKEYTKDTLFTSIGCEIGKISYDSENYYILKNNKIIKLNKEEYECWRTLNLTIKKMEQLEFKYSKGQNEIMDGIIKPLLEKKIVIHWNEDTIWKSSNVRISNQGNKKKYNPEQKTYTIESVLDLGYSPQISEFAYKLWLICSVDKTIKEIVEEMIGWECNEQNKEGTKEYVLDNIRALMSLGLIRVDMI